MAAKNGIWKFKCSGISLIETFKTGLKHIKVFPIVNGLTGVDIQNRMTGIWSFLVCPVLTLKTPITTAADDIHKYFFLCCSEKIRLDVSHGKSSLIFFKR